MRLQVKELLEVLHYHQVHYVLFGTLGAIAYGAELTTRDMDICFETSEPNLRQIADVLHEVQAKPTYTPGWNTLEFCERWQPEPPTVENLDQEFTTIYGKLDVVPRPFGANGKADRFDYKHLKKRAVTLYPFNIPLDVAHIDDLIASKMSALRDKDNYVFTELERIQRLLYAGNQLPGLQRFPDGIEYVPPAL
jgi:hypothetical protein